MTFKETDKEIIRAIVKYGDDTGSLAQIINKSELLEKRGIVIAFASDRNYVFLDKQNYEWNDKRALSFITEFINLVKYLSDNHYITILNDNTRGAHVIGRKNSKLIGPGKIAVEDAHLDVESNMGNWYDYKGEQTYWPICYSEREMLISTYLDCWVSVCQELKNLIDVDFQSEEQIRFEKQQRLMWISIIVTGFIGLAGLIVAIIGILIK